LVVLNPWVPNDLHSLYSPHSPQRPRPPFSFRAKLRTPALATPALPLADVLVPARQSHLKEARPFARMCVGRVSASSAPLVTSVMRRRMGPHARLTPPGYVRSSVLERVELCFLSAAAKGRRRMMKREETMQNGAVNFCS